MKLLKGLLSVLLVFGLFGCKKQLYSDSSEEVTIQVTIVDETVNKELFRGELTAKGSDLTLEDVLVANAEKIQLVHETGSFGIQIHGLMGVETTEWNAGPWWMYSSVNNQSCVDAGYCDGASKLNVSSGDEFTFTFSNGY